MSRYVPRPQPTTIPTAAWDERPLCCLQVNSEWVSHMLGVLVALDQQDTWIGTDEEIWLARQQVNEIMNALMPTCLPVLTAFNIFGDLEPDVPNSTDTNPVELGVIWYASVDGFVTGIRFYKGDTNLGLHTGHLFSSIGDVLGEIEFADETSSGWQVAYFDEPIAVTADALYIAAYFCEAGSYSYTRPFWPEDYINEPLTAPTTSDIANNGVYTYENIGVPPTNSFAATNYFVDVVFEASVS